MRTILLIAVGVVLCLVVEIGIGAFQSLRHPLEPIQNDGYDLVQVADKSGTHLFDLRRGESKLLPYGAYRVTIPDAKVSFTILKNNRGFCDIHSVNGVVVMEIANAAMIDEVRQEK